MMNPPPHTSLAAGVLRDFIFTTAHPFRPTQRELDVLVEQTIRRAITTLDHATITNLLLTIRQPR